MITRRSFLRTSSLATVTTIGRFAERSPFSAMKRYPSGDFVSRLCGDRVPQWCDPELHALAMRALDAATSAGASYADVRFTVTRSRRFGNDQSPYDTEDIAVGVRTLTNGVWGFAATTSPWTLDAMSTLARTASDQARGNAWSDVRPIDLGERPPATTGHWETPMTRDPFTVSPAEVADLRQRANALVRRLGAKSLQMALNFCCQDRVFASSDGTYVTQRIHTALRNLMPHGGGESGISVYFPEGNPLPREMQFVTPTGGGYEVVDNLRLLDRIPAWIETYKGVIHAAPEEFSDGDYDFVFDSYAMQALLANTLAPAVQYDRVIGNDANSNGTSMFGPPEQWLNHPCASPVVTLTADRTLPRGVATVGWDDDGVSPRPFPVIQDGILVNYATTREYATELVPWHQRRDVSVRSNGSAASESALFMPVIHAPNFVLRPSPDGHSFDALVSGIDRGYAIVGSHANADFQQRTGAGDFKYICPVRHGKLGPPICPRNAQGLIYQFKSPAIWHNLLAVGNASTVTERGWTSAKGSPVQSADYTISAPAGLFQKVRLVTEHVRSQ